MDDLKLLGGLRADAPEPGLDRLDALRARALRRRRARLAPPLFLMAAATGVAVVVAGGVGAPVPDAPTTARPVVTAGIRQMNAEVVLRRAARVAERGAPVPAARDDQWMYWKLLVQNGDDPAPVAEEYWHRFDGTAQSSRRAQGGMEHQAIEPEPGDDQLTPREFAAEFAELATDPARLLDRVQNDPVWKADGEHEDARAFRVFSVFLYQEVPLPPKLRGAMFRALAEIPGVRVDADVRDAAGRTGIGVAFEGDVPGSGVRRDLNGQVTTRSYLIFDDTTYEFIGRRVERFKNELIGTRLMRAGTEFVSAVVATGVVDEPGQLPG
ncbi:CU044_5270 family protein [Herbidospora daliensis]|uniref:CU044_5270 family protein n=1 Tax=Herbidospora daliensis TaxID=295585 RepID=UPI0007834D22|nr:CU044_5270 family protein [Herbidospora daliensis]